MGLSSRVLVLLRQCPLRALRTDVWKRMQSSSCVKKDESCCGVRDDCHLRPCKGDESDCYSVVRLQHRDNCSKDALNVGGFYPVCCEDCDRAPLFDWLYYRISDKATRKYQKTWVDCPPREKLKCCRSEIPEFPPFKRRQRKKAAAAEDEECRPPTACESNKIVFDVVCAKKVDTRHKCPYINLECCAPGRKPPSCKKIRVKKDCTKTCCPYPSFSECCIGGRAKVPGRAIQCVCLDRPDNCTLNRTMQKEENKPKKI